MRGQAGYLWPGQGSVQASREGLGAWESRIRCPGGWGGQCLGPRTKLLQFPQLQWLFRRPFWEDGTELRASEGQPALLGPL